MIKNALWLFGFTIFALYVFLPSYTKLQDLRQKNVEYSKQIEDLKLRKIRLMEEKRRLEQDPAYLEKVGREKMGLIRDGEVVYKITQPANAVKK